MQIYLFVWNDANFWYKKVAKVNNALVLGSNPSYNATKIKNPAPCTPFAFNPNGNGRLSGVHTWEKVCTLLTPPYQKKEFNLRIGGQSFVYRRIIVCVCASNRLRRRKRLLTCLPSPVGMASIPCEDGFLPPIDPI